MKLQEFLRAVTCLMFQPKITQITKSLLTNEPLSYEHSYFHLPRIVCKDGFNVSIQVNSGNYCSTECGYRKFGLVWETVEFGFSNVNEPGLAIHSDGQDSTDGVGSITVDDLQTIFDDNHGGIDWEETLSIDVFARMLGIKIEDSFKRLE